ncbi:MAG TPA: tetratricopeptide repeat protein, partial [Longimicrobiaceae bacterium]|nr:tetratricopeptide repeat protein [Longimicrobiaceae bacterium]
MPAKGPTKRTRPSARSRPMRAVPPLTATEGEAEGSALLREVGGALGVLLWGALRDVMLWIGTAPEERGALFGPGAAGARAREVEAGLREPELIGPLLTLLLLVEQPAQVDPARVLHACRRVAAWAADRGHTATRLAFTQVVALAARDDARAAIDTARLARQLGEYPRAETWFRATIHRARHRDWESYVWAYIGLAVLYRATGNIAAALSVARRALAGARRRRLHGLRGVALHHLFALAIESPEHGRAYDYAWAAFEAYGDDHPRLPLLANDVATWWADHGQFARALPVFEAVLPRVDDPAERALVASNLARAAAGTGDLARYRFAYASALHAMTRPGGAAR